MLLLALALPAQAQERFHIERIDVRHLVHASADVIRAESRLREGESYDESELRDANNRIKRLPFILDATFQLERGSVRDAYVLVISVNETKPFFYVFDIIGYRRRRIELDAEDALLAGGRWFAGKRDVFHAAAIVHRAERPFEAEYASLQGGYTRYGLLGDRAFATLTVDRIFGKSVRLLPGAVIGVSLSPKRTLTISTTGYDNGQPVRRSGRIFEARFAHNTTNHPFFPSEGILLSVAPVVAHVDNGGNAVVPPTHALDAGVDAHAAEYWPLTQRLTLAAIADGGFVDIRNRGGGQTASHAGYGSAMLRLSRALNDPNDSDVQNRAELSLRAASRRRDLSELRRDSSVQLNAAWVHRNAWGLVRLGLGYAW